MRKLTIRSRFFGSLAIYTLINYLLIAIVLLSFDYYEYRQNPSLIGEELEEMAVVCTVMLVLFPLGLLAAWGVSRWLLQPWRSVVIQAEHISAGRLEERIQADNPSDEIGRLVATLNHTFDEYQQLLDRMHRFSYDASHQLRNPLAAIRTKGEVCLKQSRSGKQYRETLEEILDSTVRLSRTVDQLLLLARAAGGALDDYRRPVDMTALVSGIVEEGQLIGELRDISINLVAAGELKRVNGVPDLLREAVSNLVDNALKFSPDGGRIEVRLRSLSPSRVRIEVADSGPGLTPVKRASIFRPFERDRSDSKEGAGLGLAIVADVCQAHHGAFGVEDDVLGGSCFWMELPI